MSQTPNRHIVLITDDEPINLHILSGILIEKHEVLIATNGSDALACARGAKRPDIVLLDINMPGMDGYEVCSRIKADPLLNSIPVIFITSLSDVENETRGLEAGAVDYITKPFNSGIVAARVRTHLELKNHRDHLEQLAERRAAQLVHAERLATLGTLSAGVAHEINSPLTYVSVYAQMLNEAFAHSGPDLDAILRTLPQTPSALKRFLDLCATAFPAMIEGSMRISAIVSSMRDFARKDGGERKPYRIENCIEAAIKLAHNELKHRATVQKVIEPGLPEVQVIHQQIEQVLINLLRNAADEMEKSPKSLIVVGAKAQGDKVVVTVEDNGPGIPPDKMDKIWEAFYTTKPSGKGTGLGLPISRGIIEDHKGTLRAENRSEGGARFIIELPVKP